MISFKNLYFFHYFYYLFIVFSLCFYKYSNDTINTEDIASNKLVFSLKNQKTLSIEFLKVLTYVLQKKPIEQLLFIHKLLQQNNQEKVLQILETNQQILLLNNVAEDPQMEKQIKQMMDMCNGIEEVKIFIKENHMSKKLLKNIYKLLIITSNFITQQYQMDAIYATNYTVENINNNEIFSPKKIFYVFFRLKKSNKKNPWLKKIGINTINIKDKNKTLISLKKFYNNQFFITKNYNNYSHLNPGEYITEEEIINKKTYEKLIFCWEINEEKINNISFNFISIHMESLYDEHELNKLFNELNFCPVPNILMKINEIISKNNIIVKSHETYYNNNIESIAHNPQILDIVINFPHKKFLLVPQEENNYIMYLIIDTNSVDNNLGNIKSTDLVMKYILKNLE